MLGEEEVFSVEVVAFKSVANVFSCFTSCVNELLNAMYVDLEPEDVSQQYIDACVTGFLGVLAGTTLFGFGMSISLCYYNVYANLYDKAKLTALHYSLSGRVAIRLDELIGG